MDSGKAVDRYREHNTRIFNPDKFFSKDDIDAAFKHESNLFNSIEDGISILDTELNIVRVNFTMQKWYAHKPRLVGKKCYAAYHDRGEPCADCPIIKAIQTHKAHRDIVSYEMKQNSASGWHELQGFPILDGENLAGIVEYVKDITCEMDLYAKISAIEKNLGQVKSQNELLKTYIEQKETEKREIEDTIKGNVRKYIKPVLSHLRESFAERPAEADTLSFLEGLFENIVTPFLSGTSGLADFTSREIEVMSMIRAGSTSKEIADALHLTKKTVDFHRGNIRAKLKLEPGRDNLRSFLIRSHIALE